MGQRAYSLDTLRGYAIITMILSGTIASGVLPGWMYHAQLPPPTNVFNPNVYGITWVDLVFPFFLFAMGAAFPFSLGSKIESGISKWKLVCVSIERGIKLTFFAIFIQHMYPWVIATPQTPTAWFTTLCAFALMFPMFMRLPWDVPAWIRRVIEYGAYGIALIMLLTISYASDRKFSLGFSNIIILVLANMAIFGSLSYIFTYNKPMVRLAILPFVMAIFLSASTEYSWQKVVFNFSPVPWMYKMYYLKYLFIVIPGSIAGEYLKSSLTCKNSYYHIVTNSRVIPSILALTVGLVVFNLYGLYMRNLQLNLIVTVGILGILHYLLKGEGVVTNYWRQLLTAGAFFLLLGLCFEAYEGGIRKDNSTYSYYFVTSGLAFIVMITFSILCDLHRWKALKPLEMAGQNPMIAYVATNMAVMPLMKLTGVATWIDMMITNPWLGFFRGVIMTSCAVLLAVFFTKIKWFWRT